MYARDEDDGRALEARVLVDQLRRLEPVHVRHADVEQHDRELLVHQLLERLAPGMRKHQVLAKIAEHGLIGQQPRRLIIYQQDVDLAARHRDHRS